MELTIYEFIGVEWFKKQTLKLEKIIHHRDKGYSINYHPKTNDLDGLKEYLKFLYYNGSIHVKNSILYSIIIPILFLLPLPGIALVNILFIPLLVLNLYCVMLQRYTGIRINSCIRAREELNKQKIDIKAKRIKKLEKENKITVAKNIDSQLLDNLIKYLQNKQDVILTENDLEKLLAIKDCLNDLYQPECNIETDQNYPIAYRKK